MLSIIEYLKRPSLTCWILLRDIGSYILPDRLYLKLSYILKMKEPINMKNPKKFTEKLQWLKLYDRKPEYTTMVDKYAVKEFVAKKIGTKYIIPTIGIWDHPEDIDFNILPKQFVLKTTHGGGSCGVVICYDKENFDKDVSIKMLKKSLKQNIYKNLREWPYKNVKRQVIAEKLLTNDDSSTDTHELIDYKFYCFNGTPTYCQVIQGRRTNETIDFFDMEWNHMEFYGLNPIAKPASKPIAKPDHFEKMKEIAKKLSEGIPFVRVDLYSTVHQPYFGELTFYPASGFGVFTPKEWDEKLGEMINLPKKR